MSVADIFTEAGNKVLALGGKLNDDTSASLKELAAKLEPEFEEATNSDDPRALDFLADRTAAATIRLAANSLADTKEQLSVIAWAIVKGLAFAAL